MSRKNHIIDAFEGRTSSLVPIWELEFHLWNKFSDCPILLGECFEKLTLKEKEVALHQNAETIAETAFNLDFSAVTIPGGYWEVSPGTPAYYWLPDPYRVQQGKILHRMVEDNILLVASTGGVLAMPDSEQYLEFSRALLETPDRIERLARDLLKESLEQAKRFRDIGVAAFYTASDLADNRGLYFNPGQMERFILPYLKQWAQSVREMLCYAILHTDGNISSIVEELQQTGIHALQAIDPVAGMDIVDLKSGYGNSLCLCGNVDCGLLLTAKPETVYDNVRELLSQMMEQPGFVLGASNAVQADVPKENYMALIEAWRYNKSGTRSKSIQNKRELNS